MAEYRALCPQCGYDLTPFPAGQCSECGFGYEQDIIRAMARGYFHDRIWYLQRSITLSLCAYFWWPFAWSWPPAGFVIILLLIGLVAAQYVNRLKLGKWIGDPWWVGPLVVVTLIFARVGLLYPQLGIINALVLCVAAIRAMRASKPPWPHVPECLSEKHLNAIRLWLAFAWGGVVLNLVGAIIAFT